MAAAAADLPAVEEVDPPTPADAVGNDPREEEVQVFLGSVD